MTDRIILTGMSFFGYHGVLPEETRLGQRFILDVEMNADLRPAGQLDDLARTIDYGKVYEDIKSIVEGPACQLLEAVAERIASVVLLKYPVEAVLVRVHKPGAPIPGSLERVSVEVTRRKGA